MEMLVRIDKFADYFAICGLDLKSGLEPDHFAGTYLCSILYRFMFCNVYF